MTAAAQNKGKLKARLVTKYHLNSRRIKTAIEDAKQRLQGLSHRLKRYTARGQQFQLSKTF